MKATAEQLTSVRKNFDFDPRYIEIMASLKGTALREAGGVYWIPDEGVAIWERVISAFQEEAARIGHACMVEAADW